MSLLMYSLRASARIRSASPLDLIAMLHRLPQRRVVDAEVNGLVVLDGAALGPGGGHRDARSVDPAGRFQRALHRADGRVPARTLDLVPHQPQAVAQFAPAEAVHVIPQRIGHRRPHRAVAPRAQLGGKKRQLARRARGIGGGGAVLPLVRADVFAGRGVYRQHRGAQPRDEALAREGRVRRVPMAAVYLDLALLVGLAVDVADHLERRFRQSGQRGAVFAEQPVLVHAFLVMLLGEPEASVQELLVVRFDAGQPWHGNEEVLPDEVHLPLHVALLVAGIRVAEAEFEAVMGGEGREGLGGPDAAADLAPDAGGVVEHDAGWDPSYVFEHLLEGLAHAFGVLGREHLGEPDVRIGEREHEETQPPPRSHDAEIRLPEIGLRLAGPPNEVEVRLGNGLPQRLEVADVMPDGRFAALDAVLVAKALPYAAGGVALFAPVRGVLVEPRLYDPAVPVERLGLAPLHGHPRRQVRDRELRVHRVARDARLAGDFRYGLAVLPHLPYRIGLRHADHTFPTSLVGFPGRNQVSRLRWSACLPLCSN